MKTKYIADFETVYNEEKDQVVVWLCGIVELFSERIEIRKTLTDFLDYCKELSGDVVIYFHNLKFDGMYILDYILRYKNFTQIENFKKLNDKNFSIMVDGQGRWYALRIKWKRKVIEFRDSQKMVNMSVEDIGREIGKYEKGEIDYTKHRDVYIDENGKYIYNYEVLDEEIEYIKKDLLIVKEVLEGFESSGLLSKYTIGSSCLDEYKRRFFNYNWKILFPVLDDEMDKKLREAYRGGWCYTNPKYKEKVLTNGKCYDIRSLYPYVMRNYSLPVGNPHYFKKEEFEKYKNTLFFVRLRASLFLKEGKLPFLQNKRHLMFYMHRENDFITDTKGEIIELTLTKYDFDLLFENYYVEELDILEGWAFCGRKGLFDEYIDYWYERKKNAKNKVERTIAKAMLNNLSGKFGTSKEGESLNPYIGPNGIKFEHVEKDKRIIYIPVAAYITSIARSITIKAAQDNYDNFIYSDTDSIHLLGDNANGIIIGEELGEWKIEADWTIGKFLRQKTYIEKDKKDGWLIKCSGCTKDVKREFLKMSDEELLDNFKIGFSIFGKLKQVNIKGGAYLKPDYFTIRDTSLDNIN